MNHKLIIEGQHVLNGDYAGLQLSQFVSIGSSFEDCDFSNMKVEQATFGGGQSMSVYKRCAFNGSIFRAVAPGTARFEDCSFMNVHFSELNCRRVEFVNCVFSGVTDKGYFSGSDTVHASNSLRTVNEFYGNDLRDMELVDVDFRNGIDLRLQKLPSGEKYVYIGEARKFLEKVGSMKDALPDKELGAMLKIIERDVLQGQEQIILNIDGFPTKFRRAIDFIRGVAASL